MRLLLLLLITGAAFALLGYHPGVEDDGTYLAAIEHTLHPALFPHDLPFVAAQLQISLYPNILAAFVRVTRLPLALSCMIWQLGAMFLLFWCCWHILALCFRTPRARWGGVCALAASLAMPVADTHLFLVDQHLHPRLLATDCILFAVFALLRRRPLPAAIAMILGTLMHPLMAVYGVSFCLLLRLEQWQPLWWRGNGLLRRSAAIPASWLWQAPTPTAQRITAGRTFLFADKWPWYAWIGVLLPLLFAEALRRFGMRRGLPELTLLSSTILVFGTWQLLLALVLLHPGMPPWFVQFEPMRFLHLVYLFMIPLGAASLAECWLRRRPLLSLLLLVPLTLSMYLEQRQEFAGSPYIEWPGAKPSNPWLQSFAWVRTHTPVSAYFALDPFYLRAPSEGVHSFRALAERSMLADQVKDPGIITHVPSLARRWQQETDATRDWASFGLPQFELLRQQFGVGWVIVTRVVPGLPCPYHTGVVRVCRIPAD